MTLGGGTHETPLDEWRFAVLQWSLAPRGKLWTADVPPCLLQDFPVGLSPLKGRFIGGYSMDGCSSRAPVLIQAAAF